ncbi:MAG: DMT family transporter [Planctomycetota bacterium]|nr:DMT family transporter [Planctomycetota bacterium]
MNKNHLLAVLLAAIWAGHFLLMNSAAKIISPFITGAAVRFGTFLILTAMLMRSRSMGRLCRLDGAGAKLFCIGALGFLLDATSFIGFRYSNADTGTVLLKTDVIMANAMTIMIYRFHFGKLDWFFTATILVGVCLVLGVNPYDLHFQPFDIFFVMSAFFVTLNAFLIQHVQRRHGTSNTVIAYYNNLFTLLIFSAVASAAGLWGELAEIGRNRELLAVLALGAAAQTLIYVFYYKCLARLPVYLIKILLLLIPVFTMLFNVAVMGRRLTFMHLAGSVLVLGSAFGVLYFGRNRKANRGAASPAD